MGLALPLPTITPVPENLRNPTFVTFVVLPAIVRFVIYYYPGKDCIFETYCFIHNTNYYLTTLKVFEGGGIECWGPMDKAEFLAKTSSGWITIDVPDGTEVRIGDQGFVFTQAKTLRKDGGLMFAHKWITQADFVKAVLDAVHVGLGNKSASEICFDAYHSYILDPSKSNLEELRKAYLEVPAHNRCYILGDQDLKDFPIRDVLGL